MGGGRKKRQPRSTLAAHPGTFRPHAQEHSGCIPRNIRTAPDNYLSTRQFLERPSPPKKTYQSSPGTVRAKHRPPLYPLQPRRRHTVGADVANLTTPAPVTSLTHSYRRCPCGGCFARRVGKAPERDGRAGGSSPAEPEVLPQDQRCSCRTRGTRSDHRSSHFVQNAASAALSCSH